MTLTPFRLVVACLVPSLFAGVVVAHQSGAADDQINDEMEVVTDMAEEKSLTVQYLEIVTPAVDKTCEALSGAHGIVFGDPVPEFGNARTAKLGDGGRIGVRAPMRETETPVVRPYVLVDDINAAVAAAEKAGAVVALPPMEIPGQGMFSIYILGGIEHGLWQN